MDSRWDRASSLDFSIHNQGTTIKHAPPGVCHAAQSMGLCLLRSHPLPAHNTCSTNLTVTLTLHPQPEDEGFRDSPLVCHLISQMRPKRELTLGFPDLETQEAPPRGPEGEIGVEGGGKGCPKEEGKVRMRPEAGPPSPGGGLSSTP